MDCKYLTGLKYPRCLASQKLMLPSVLEQVVFCHGEPDKCPYYEAHKKDAIQVEKVDSGDNTSTGLAFKR